MPHVFPCPHCRKKFTRPSHLDRHRLTHLPAGHKSLLPCPRCSATFSRRDVLLRHLRTTHQEVQTTERRSAQKSCNRCVAKKRKCERERPCRACVAAQVPCEYAPDISPDALDPIDTTTQSIGVVTGLEDGSSSVSPPRMQHRPSNASFIDASPAPGPGPVPAANASFHQTLPPNSPFESTYSPCDPGAVPHQGLQQNGAPFGTQPYTNTESLLSGMPDYMAPDDTAFSPSFLALTQPDFRTTGLDWLSFDIPDVTPGSGPPPYESLNQTRPWTSSSSAFHHSGMETGERSIIHHPSQQYHGGQVRTAVNSPSLRPMEPIRLNQPWPFDQEQDSTPHRYSLPPLRNILHKSLGAQNPRLSGLLPLLSDNRLPNLSLLQGTNAPQALSDLHRLLDLYFSRFHDIQAIVHRPTWDKGSCPTVLLTAMACMGALLSDDEQDAELSWSLSEVCMPMITWLGASDSANYRDISYINALCLHQIYSLGSGNRQLYQHADRSRGILIGSLRGIGLLTSSGWNVDVEDHDTANSTMPSNHPELLAREWTAWISREQDIRAAWAAFEYDCSLSTLTARRGVVDLSELPRKLPCGEALWNASSAQAWLALRSRMSASSFSPDLSATIKEALAGRKPSPTLGAWAKRVCCQLIGRLLWDLKQLEVVAMPEHFGLSSLLGTQQRSKQSLLRALNVLLSGMSNPSSTPELISYNISSLLCHYSHLYAAEDVMDIIVFLVRSHISQRGPKLSPTQEVAKKRLRSTFAKDIRTSRLLLWHAAQIVAVANEYLVSAPCEVMRVFMGYIFVLAYSAYGPPDEDDITRHKEPIPLDEPSHEGLPQSQAVAEWIKTGGPASMGSVRDICAKGSAPEIARDAQAMMQRLKCWGLAEKFSRILHIFEENVF